MSASAVVHMVLLITFASAIAWLWRDAQFDRQFQSRAVQLPAASVTSAR